MKTNDYLLLTATAAYSYLFFQQNPGINFPVFNLLLILLLAVKNRDVIFNKKWLWSAGMCLVSSACIFVHNSELSIIANVSSLLLLSAFSVNVVTSSIFSFLFSCYSVLSSMVFIVIHAVLRSQKPAEGAPAKSGGYRLVAILIVVLLSILFFLMYQQSNPLFAENTKWINFDFISFYWVVFTLSGLLVVYGLLYHQSIPDIEHWENRLALGNPGASDEEPKVKRYNTEHFAGILLFAMLNLMLIVLNAGDVQTLYFRGGLPKGMSHSDFVHHGVGVIILSILFATALIMYLFRRNFSMLKQSKTLKILVYGWILQNLLMLSSTAFRNQIYIHDYNYTYKRIGVYVWLLLAAIGLILAFIKVYRERSNWFLVKQNFAVWFTVLTLSSTINWDILITRYNMANKPIYQVDFHYLLSLSDANIPDLLEFTKRSEFKYINNHMVNYESPLSDYRYETYIEMLSKKVYWFIANHPDDWRSYDLREDSIRQALYKH
ncbi:MAG: DUF4173 domain-containing protein [Bacteroidetes bacterium]|nr:DUF4173 domain-containing protein [Bacteroidota bacterium]